MPSMRLPYQRYIFWEIEPSAYLTSFVPENYNNFFNWSITYRQDSTVSLPYGWLWKFQGHPKGKELDDYIKDFGKKNKDLALKVNNGSASVAWMVSNCLTESNREGYVEALQKFIDIDIYGSCYEGLKCEKASPENCWNEIDKKYKFYLAFENSICKDYVTEKLFEPMSRNIIPVVLGGANYSKLLPPNSYIDAFNDFAEDPRGLANLLHKIAADDAVYGSYFWWKDFYEVAGLSPKDRASAPCQICQLFMFLLPSALKNFLISM